MAGIKLAVFDMDGTLIEEKSSWGLLHRHFKTEHVGRRGLELYSKGLIDYEEFMRIDTSAWPEGIDISTIEGILSRYRLRDDAVETVSRLREMRIEVAMISAGLDVLAKRVAADLGIEHWLANSLRIGSDGRLSGGGVGNVDPSHKELALERLFTLLSASREETIAVGDSVYDLSILRAARVGFLIGDERVDDQSIVRIGDLREIFAHELLRG